MELHNYISNELRTLSDEVSYSYTCAYIYRRIVYLMRLMRHPFVCHSTSSAADQRAKSHKKKYEHKKMLIKTK